MHLRHDSRASESPAVLVALDASRRQLAVTVNEDPQYEVYRELFLVTEWRDGAVYRTISRGHNWFLTSVVDDNRPRDTNLIYASASDEFSKSNSTIRLIRSTGA